MTPRSTPRTAADARRQALWPCLGALVLLIALGHGESGAASPGPGVIDSTFAPETGADGSVFCLARHKAGRILIGGLFSRYDGQISGYLARIHPDGSFDPSFDVAYGPKSAVRAVIALADGRILVAGDFDKWGKGRGEPVNHLVRLLSDGRLDRTFVAAPNFERKITSMIRDDQGRLWIAGFDRGLEPSRGPMRLLENGDIDPSFRPTGPPGGHRLASASILLHLQQDERVIVAGVFDEWAGQPLPGLLRLLPDGAVDRSFKPGVSGVDWLAPRRKGGFWLAGDPKDDNGESLPPAVAVDAEWRLIRDFEPNLHWSGSSLGKARVRFLHEQPDGRIVVGGLFDSVDGVARRGIVRLFPNGRLDPSFEPGSGFPAQRVPISVLLLDDRRLLVGGYFTSYSDHPAGNLVSIVLK